MFRPGQKFDLHTANKETYMQPLTDFVTILDAPAPFVVREQDAKDGKNNRLTAYTADELKETWKTPADHKRFQWNIVDTDYTMSLFMLGCEEVITKYNSKGQSEHEVRNEKDALLKTVYRKYSLAIPVSKVVKLMKDDKNFQKYIENLKSKTEHKITESTNLQMSVHPENRDAMRAVNMVIKFAMMEDVWPETRALLLKDPDELAKLATKANM